MRTESAGYFSARSMAERELRRWASALSILSAAPGSVARPMLSLLGPRPYLFERNPRRWPDGLFHLVERGYEPFGLPGLSEEQLRAAGVVAWTKTRWQRLAFADGMYPLTDDAFMNAATPLGLRRLSQLLYAVLELLKEVPPGIENAPEP